MNNATHIFRESCVKVLCADERRCKELLNASSYYSVDYIEKLGYDMVSKIISENTPEQARKILDAAVAVIMI